MAGKPRLSREQYNEIVRRWRVGESTGDIAAFFDISIGHVQDIIIKRVPGKERAEENRRRQAQRLIEVLERDRRNAETLAKSTSFVEQGVSIDTLCCTCGIRIAFSGIHNYPFKFYRVQCDSCTVIHCDKSQTGSGFMCSACVTWLQCGYTLDLDSALRKDIGSLRVSMWRRRKEEERNDLQTECIQ